MRFVSLSVCVSLTSSPCIISHTFGHFVLELYLSLTYFYFLLYLSLTHFVFLLPPSRLSRENLPPPPPPTDIPGVVVSPTNRCASTALQFSKNSHASAATASSSTITAEANALSSVPPLGGARDDSDDVSISLCHVQQLNIDNHDYETHAAFEINALETVNKHVVRNSSLTEDASVLEQVEFGTFTRSIVECDNLLEAFPPYKSCFAEKSHRIREGMIKSRWRGWFGHGISLDWEDNACAHALNHTIWLQSENPCFVYQLSPLSVGIHTWLLGSYLLDLFWSTVVFYGY